MTVHRLMTISELLEGALALDEGVYQGLHHYFRYGLDPGSFGRACLLGDYELAKTKAHTKLLETHFGQDIILNMVSYASAFPSPCTGTYENIENWIQIGGLEQASKDVVVLCKLEWSEELFMTFPYKETV